MIRVPGDKSISHRALLLAALADGESRLSGLLPGADCRSTASVLRRMGVDVPEIPPDGAPFRIQGVGLTGLTDPGPDPLDCGNSGTTARLLLGLLAGAGVRATLTGDDSLRSRPMRRVTEPLSGMGAEFREEGEGGRLPLRIRGPVRHTLEYRSPVASAQVKSALLLAGLAAGVSVTVSEPGRSRDHTERMLRMAGVPIHEEAVGDRWRVTLPAPPAGRDRWSLLPLDLQVPADISSAIFPIALGVLGGAGGPDQPLRLERVGLNPTRTGALTVLERMGARIEHDGPWAGAGATDPDAIPLNEEPSAELTVHPGPVKATVISGDEIPTLIDEIPILAVVAARAEGRTEIRDAEELRVKESDRIHALVSNFRILGVEVEEFPDGLAVTGSERPLEGTVESFHDHRIAMAFAVLGALPGNRIRISEHGSVEISYPGFWEALSELSTPSGGVRPRPVVTIDGPAGSGKSSTARAVAGRLGYRHLDSGALFRAVTLGLLRSGRDESEWNEVELEELEAMQIGLEPAGTRFDVRMDGEGVDEALRGAEVTRRVPRVATIPAVREWLLRRQREAARDGGVVVDGRDTGSVVFPDAAVKIFLTAGLEERARRRLLQDRGEDAGEPTIEDIRCESEQLAERDRQDESRAMAPLRRPDDAIDVDTTALSFEEQVATVVDAVHTWSRERG